MKKFLMPIVVELYGDYLGDADVTVSLDDEQYDRLAALVREYNDRGEELSEDTFSERLPEVYSSIKEQVDAEMPNGIDLQEGEDLDDYYWYIQYPDDICEILDEDEGWGID